MAALAHGFEIVIGAILWRVVKVGNRQDHNRARDAVLGHVPLVAAVIVGAADIAAAMLDPAFPATLALPLGALPDSQADCLPILWISSPVLFTNWHGSPSTHDFPSSNYTAGKLGRYWPLYAFHHGKLHAHGQ